MNQDYRWCESPLKTRGLGWTIVSLLVKMLITHSTLSDKTVSADHLDVSHSELQQMNGDCYPQDSCKERGTEDILTQSNCHCGSFCVDFDTCCLDSNFRNTQPQTKTPHSCVHVYGQKANVYVFMAVQCASNWSGDDYTRAMCVGNPETLNDPLLLLPFTSSKTLLTYKNTYCAECNHERGDQGTFWNVRLTRSRSDMKSSSIEGIPIIAFDSDAGSWRLPEFSGSPTVAVSVEIPEGPDVKACRDSVISTCAADWTDDVTRWKCSSYMAMITANRTDYSLQRYRNVHCAICNHEVNFQTVCRYVPRKTGYGGSSHRPGPSFALLLDINKADGNRVGEVQRCKSNEKYDPFSKRCRALRCGIPGYVIRNGSCVRQ